MRALAPVLAVVCSLASPAAPAARCKPGSEECAAGPLTLRFDAALGRFDCNDAARDCPLRRGSDGAWIADLERPIELVIQGPRCQAGYTVKLDEEALAIARPAVYGEQLAARDFAGFAALERTAGGVTGRVFTLDSFAARTGRDSLSTALGEARDRVLHPEGVADAARAAGTLAAQMKELQDALARLCVDERCGLAEEQPPSCPGLADLAGRIRDQVGQFDRLGFEGEMLLAASAALDTRRPAARQLAEAVGLLTLLHGSTAAREQAKEAAGEELALLDQPPAGALAAAGQAVADATRAFGDLDRAKLGLGGAYYPVMTRLRRAVDAFNRTAETAAIARPDIRVPLPRAAEQKRWRISVWENPVPARLSLTFTAPATSSARPAPIAAASGSVAAAGSVQLPAADTAGAGALRDVLAVDLHQRFHFQMFGGIVRSGVDDDRFELQARKIDGVARQEIVHNRHRGYRIQPVLSVALYPWGKDVNRNSYREWRQWMPGPMFGFSLAEPSRHVFAGLLSEPVAGLGLSAGFHWAKTEELREGFTPGQLLEAGDALPVRERFRRGLFLGLNVDTAVFSRLVLGIFKP